MMIYLMRHGETDWNREYRFQGQADIPLNQYGRELARKTAQALGEIPFGAAFSSPLCRAVETAGIVIGNRRIPFETDERLKEMNFGTLEGTVVWPGAPESASGPLHILQREPENYIPPENGEAFEEMYRRSAAFLQERLLPLEGKYGTVLVVGHGAVNRSILNQIAGIPLKDFWHIQLKNCAVSVLSLENGRFRIIDPGRVYYE